MSLSEETLRMKPRASRGRKKPAAVRASPQVLSEEARIERKTYLKSLNQLKPQLIQKEDLRIIRERLQINKYWSTLPDELLIQAFQGKESSKAYPWANRELMEFLGDAIIQLIVTKIMLNIPAINSPGSATILKGKIVRNSTLECFLNKLDLCKYSAGVISKGCADSFEALIGIIYKWSEVSKKDNILNSIENWFIENFQLPKLIEKVAETGDLPCDIITKTLSENSSDSEDSEISSSEEESNPPSNKILIQDPLIQKTVSRYRKEFAEEVPEYYLEPKNIEAWSKALAFASRLGVIPFAYWSEFYKNPKIEKELLKIEQNLEDEEFVEEIHSILYVDSSEESYKKSLNKINKLLLGIKNKDSNYIQELLRLTIALNIFPKLDSVSADSPGEFIQDLLKRVVLKSESN